MQYVTPRLIPTLLNAPIQLQLGADHAALRRSMLEHDTGPLQNMAQLQKLTAGNMTEQWCNVPCSM